MKKVNTRKVGSYEQHIFYDRLEEVLWMGKNDMDTFLSKNSKPAKENIYANKLIINCKRKRGKLIDLVMPKQIMITVQI